MYRMSGIGSSILVLLLSFACVSRLSAQPYQLVDAFPGLAFTRPIHLTHSGDGTNRLFVVQQNGIIRVFANDSTATSAKTFLDVSKKISASGGEEGLLGLAFHPAYASNGYFYINYTAPAPLRTVISRFHVSATDPSVADTIEQKILEINQPFSNHNGGMIAFGPDGYLYIGTGDGGSGGDPQNNGQSLTTLLGKILRIDISGTTPGAGYIIPSSNPFAGNQNGYRQEIWAYGLRNPWRFSFDRVTGQLWAGDVGQGSREEVDLIEKGKNYGWRIMEGFSCYSPSTGCDQTGLTLPLIDYSHSVGISVTGGYVYRGLRRPGLIGAYIYGDYGSRRIWALRMNGSQILSDSLLLVAADSITAFGEDEAGELYVVAHSFNRVTHIFRFNRSFATGSSTEFTTPTGFSLEQNFPNPFNPGTMIGYTIAGTRHEALGNRWVKLAVYDMLGREVAVLVDGPKAPGEYSVQFDGRALVSGVYCYRLEAGQFVGTKAMVLVK
jgi:glucose/arabinose dehydrogenase